MTNSTSIQFTKPFKACDADLDKVTYPIMVFPKIDGVRGLNREGIFLGRSLKAHKNLWLGHIMSHKKYSGLDGELACGGVTSQSLCRDTTSSTGTIYGSFEFTYNCFDLLDDEHINLPYLERYNALQQKMMHDMPIFIKAIHYVWANCNADVLNAYDLYLEMGYEGVVLRDPNAMHKNGRCTKNQAAYLRIKPKGDAEGIFHHFDEAMHNGNVAKKNALGETERSSHKANKTGLGMIGALWLTPIGGGEPFKVGPGRMNHQDRKWYFENPQALATTIIKFQFFDHGAKDKYRHAVFLSFRNQADMEC